MNTSIALLKNHKLQGLALALGLLAISAPTPGEAYYYRGYHHHGFGPGLAIGTAAAIITGAAIAHHGYYYGPSYYNGPYPYYRTGYYYGNGANYYGNGGYYYGNGGNYYGSCQRVYVNCYWRHDRYHHSYRQCYRSIRWVC